MRRYLLLAGRGALGVLGCRRKSLFVARLVTRRNAAI